MKDHPSLSLVRIVFFPPMYYNGVQTLLHASVLDPGLFEKLGGGGGGGVQ